ncbi:MAG: hypothetical protein ACRCYS_15005, partial [Beijerinckiaceae bacterium]
MINSDLHGLAQRYLVRFSFYLAIVVMLLVAGGAALFLGQIILGLILLLAGCFYYRAARPQVSAELLER